jgi:hypothetical protein
LYIYNFAIYIAFLKKVRYALCPMPYALCPMPYALCPVVPHLSEKGYIYNTVKIYTIAEFVSISEFQEKMTVKVDL